MYHAYCNQRIHTFLSTIYYVVIFHLSVIYTVQGYSEAMCFIVTIESYIHAGSPYKYQIYLQGSSIQDYGSKW